MMNETFYESLLVIYMNFNALVMTNPIYRVEILYVQPYLIIRNNCEFDGSIEFLSRICMGCTFR